MINEELLLEKIKNKSLLTKDELIEIINELKQPNVPKVKSAPEAILYYYIYNYVDNNVKINEVGLSTIINNKKHTFVADISFEYNNKKYIIEFDSLSYHSKDEEIIRDNLKNKLFTNNGYIVIRLRNSTKTKSLLNLDNCYNIKCQFNYLKSKKELIDNNKVLHQIFDYIGCKNVDFNFINDLPKIQNEPYWIWKKTI